MKTTKKLLIVSVILLTVMITGCVSAADNSTTTSDDTAFVNGDFDAPVMALSCCTDASDDNRIIILGRAD